MSLVTHGKSLTNKISNELININIIQIHEVAIKACRNLSTLGIWIECCNYWSPETMNNKHWIFLKKSDGMSQSPWCRLKGFRMVTASTPDDRVKRIALDDLDKQLHQVALSHDAVVRPCRVIPHIDLDILFERPWLLDALTSPTTFTLVSARMSILQGKRRKQIKTQSWKWTTRLASPSFCLANKPHNRSITWKSMTQQCRSSREAFPQPIKSLFSNIASSNGKVPPMALPIISLWTKY